MNKAFVDQMIRNMKQGDVIKKVTPWMYEGTGKFDGSSEESQKQVSVRYIGIKLNEPWQEIFSEKNNVLLKFSIDRNSAFIEFYIANTPPFFKFMTTRFTETDKWETILGECRRKLKKDKAEFLAQSEKIGNLYAKIQPHLKS